MDSVANFRKQKRNNVPIASNNDTKYMYEQSGDVIAKIDKWLPPVIQ